MASECAWGYWLECSVLIMHIGFGNFTGDSDAHQGIDFKTMAKGYFETGLLFDNLIHFSIYKIGDLNIGTGFYIRYGAYNHPTFLDNIAFRLRTNFRF